MLIKPSMVRSYVSASSYDIKNLFRWAGRELSETQLLSFLGNRRKAERVEQKMKVPTS